MPTKDTNRAYWNKQHKVLRAALDSNDDENARMIFMDQHAMVHSATMARSEISNFADEVWDGLKDELARRIQLNGEHSVIWIMWHIARIEDITMNILVAGRDQVLDEGDWSGRMGVQVRHSGNVMSHNEVIELSTRMEVDALKAYRAAVGLRTREVVAVLTAADFKQKVTTTRLQRIRDMGLVLPAADEIVQYWSKRTIAGLLLMPATRHNLMHINEALRVKASLQKI